MAEFDAFEHNYHDLIDGALEFSGKSHEFFTRAKAEYLHRELSRHFGASGRHARLEVLDVGCGHGDVHRFLEDFSPELSLTGVDVAASVIDSTQKRYPG